MFLLSVSISISTARQGENCTLTIFAFFTRTLLFGAIVLRPFLGPRALFLLLEPVGLARCFIVPCAIAICVGSLEGGYN